MTNPSRSQVPQAIRDAVQQHHTKQKPAERTPAHITRGEVVTITAPCGDTAVAVITRQQYTTHLNVVFCTNLIDMATEWDVILPPEPEPNRHLRPYRLLAETDLIIPVLYDQLGHHLGTIDTALMDTISDVSNDGGGAGLPIHHGEPRWRWKETELLRTRPFTRLAYEQLL